jgi:hypothetical protein
MPAIIYTLDLTQVNWDEMKAAVGRMTSITAAHQGC